MNLILMPLALGVAGRSHVSNLLWTERGDNGKSSNWLSELCLFAPFRYIVPLSLR